MKYASGKHARAVCDVCGDWGYYADQKDQIVNRKRTGLRVCEPCFDIDNPQLWVGTLKFPDPQALRLARPDYPDRSINWSGTRYLPPLGSALGLIAIEIDESQLTGMEMTGSLGTVYLVSDIAVSGVSGTMALGTVTVDIAYGYGGLGYGEGPYGG